MIQSFGLNELVVDLGKAAAGIGGRARKVVDKHTKAVAETYRDLVPRDQGHVADLIDYGVTRERDNIVGEAGSSAWDAHFAEYGTATQAPQAAAGPALDRQEPAFIKDLEEAAEF